MAGSTVKNPKMPRTRLAIAFPLVCAGPLAKDGAWVCVTAAEAFWWRMGVATAGGVTTAAGPKRSRPQIGQKRSLGLTALPHCGQVAKILLAHRGSRCSCTEGMRFTLPSSPNRVNVATDLALPEFTNSLSLPCLDDSANVRAFSFEAGETL